MTTGQATIAKCAGVLSGEKLKQDDANTDGPRCTQSLLVGNVVPLTKLLQSFGGLPLFAPDSELQRLPREFKSAIKKKKKSPLRTK